MKTHEEKVKYIDGFCEMNFPQTNCDCMVHKTHGMFIIKLPSGAKLEYFHGMNENEVDDIYRLVSNRGLCSECGGFGSSHTKQCSYWIHVNR